MKLILIRHGLTRANEEHRYQGSLDGELSDRGRNQLLELREKQIYQELAGFRLISSGKKRCQQTCEILLQQDHPEIMTQLQEMDFGSFEGFTYEELKDQESYQNWIIGDNETNVTPGGESGNQMKERVLESLRFILQTNQDTCIVTHGGPIAAIMTELFPEEGKNRYQWQPQPGRGYFITINQLNSRYHKL